MNLPPIMLPWPDRSLWQNSRKHWSAVASARASQRGAAHILALEAGWHKLDVPPGVIVVNWIFCPPSLRRYDMDGAQAAMKSAQDGLADALGVDDYWIQPRPHRGDKMRGGGVLVYAHATGDTWQSLGNVLSAMLQREGPAALQTLRAMEADEKGQTYASRKI